MPAENSFITQERACSEESKTLGFQLPDFIPDLPLVNKGSASHADNASMAIRMHMFCSQLMALLSIDTSILGKLMDRVLAATEDDIERSADLVFSKGAWYRIGSLPNSDYALLVQRKVNLIKSQIAEVQAIGASPDSSDIFRLSATARLQRTASELIPYDLLMNSAFNEFQERCTDIETNVHRLARFASEQLRISYRSARIAGHGVWGSPLLFPCLAKAAGFQFSLFPARAKQDFRAELISRQYEIINAASSLDIPVHELLTTWDDFRLASRRLDETLGQFALANKGLVEKAVWSYSASGDTDSIRSAAQLGLVRAMRRFAPEKGWTFSTYATSWIQQCILRDLGMKDVIRLPEGSHKSLTTLSKLLEMKPNASYDWLAKEANLSMYEVENLIYFVNQRSAVSMDSLMSSESGESSGIHEFLSDQNNDFVEELIEDESSRVLTAALKEVLSDKEIAIVSARFGLNGTIPRTLLDLANEYKLSQERIRQIEFQAIKKLKNSDYADILLELL